MRMSESNPQTPFTGLGGSFGCMVHSHTQGRRKRGGGWIDRQMNGWRWKEVKKTDIRKKTYREADMLLQIRLEKRSVF